MQDALIADLKNQNPIVQGNALVILGLLECSDALPIALEIVKNKSLGIEIRQCGFSPLLTSGLPVTVGPLRHPHEKETFKESYIFLDASGCCHVVFCGNACSYCQHGHETSQVLSGGLVNAFNQFGQLENPYANANKMLTKVHPGAKVDDFFDRTEKTRNLVRSEVWVLIDKAE